MASVKIATLLIRTIAKPISAQLKRQAKDHEAFRTFCVNLAQRMYRSEIKLRTNILGEPAKHIRPLSETKAIENGANALAEGFLFSVALSLILAEGWRSSRKDTRRREDVDDQLEDLGTQFVEMNARIDSLSARWDTEIREERARTSELTKIVQQAIDLQIRTVTEWGNLQSRVDALATACTPQDQQEPPIPDPTEPASPLPLPSDSKENIPIDAGDTKATPGAMSSSTPNSDPPPPTLSAES